jgi:hypothetical protein
MERQKHRCRDRSSEADVQSKIDGFRQAAETDGRSDSQSKIDRDKRTNIKD